MENQNEIESGKKIAIVSYILFVGVLIAMSMNSDEKNKFASFHIRQSLGLTILFLSLGLISSNFNNPWITFSFWIAISVLWVFGIFGAVKGEKAIVPIVGEPFQKIFKNL